MALSRDQKRKAQLKERKKQEMELSVYAPKPYSGRKYQSSRWVPYVHSTELAVYEVIKQTHGQLANATVQSAFEDLLSLLRSGAPGPLDPGEESVIADNGRLLEYLKWNIRRHWHDVTESHSPIQREDWAGILQTLLHSIKAHAWNTGADRGYVDFLEDFLDGDSGSYI